MESDEEGLLATNLIEELSGTDLGFHLRQGDKLLNNSQYFQITNLTKLQKFGHIDDEEDGMTDEEDAVSPRLKFKVRRKSTASVLTMPSPRRRDSNGSVMSVASHIGEDEEDDLTDMEEEILRLTVRSRTRRYSGYSAMSVMSGDGGPVPEMIDIPIIVVTVPHDTEGENETKYGWSSKGYNNFKFRFKSKLISNCYWLSKSQKGSQGEGDTTIQQRILSGSQGNLKGILKVLSQSYANVCRGEGRSTEELCSLGAF